MLDPMMLGNRLRNRSEQQAVAEAQRFGGPPAGVVPQTPLVMPAAQVTGDTAPDLSGLSTGGAALQQGGQDPRDPRQRNGVQGISIGGTRGGAGIRL